MPKVTSEISDNLAQVVKRRREAKGLSQAKVAKLAGLAQTFVGMVERGERTPTVDTANSIAAALGVKLSELIAEAEKVQRRA